MNVQKKEKTMKLIAKYAKLRQELKMKIKDITLPMSVRAKSMFELDALPRSSSRVRFRNECNLTGRKRAYYGFFGLCRHALKKLAYAGQLPGVKRASW